MKTTFLKNTLCASLLLASITLGSCKSTNKEDDGELDIDDTTEISRDSLPGGLTEDDIRTEIDTPGVNPDTIMGP